MPIQVEDVTKMLIDFKSIPKNKYKRSILEISGYPHYENVCSNILTFFCDPNNEHGLKGLVLESLIECINNDNVYIPNFEFEDVQIHREVTTIGENRLDILIKANSFVIGIENKIFHYLHNDLHDYKNTTELYATNSQVVVNIVLSLNKLNTIEDLALIKNNNFINITYDELIKKIKSKIGNYIDNMDFGYVFYLKEFMKTIENLNPKTMEQKPLWNFFRSNSDSIQELVNQFNDYKKYLYNKIFILQEYITINEHAPNCIKRWVYNKCVLVLDYEFEEKYKIAIDTTIDIDGWKIQIFGRNIESHNYLINILSKKIIFPTTKSIAITTDQRINFNSFDTEEDIENVAKSVIELLSQFEEIKNCC